MSGAPGSLGPWICNGEVPRGSLALPTLLKFLALLDDPPEA
jgi:hypothetical protein